MTDTTPAAIVTGASRGIGRALANVLARQGYALTLVARRPDSLAHAAEELQAIGGDVQFRAADLSDADAIAAVADAHEQRYGRLDVLVNSAGLGTAATFDAHETRHIDRQLDVNLRAIVLFYRECGAMLRATAADHGGAQVINMASLTGVRPQPLISVYSATKAAVIGYTRAMNAELAGTGIRSTALCPGWVDTDMTDYMKSAVPAEAMIGVNDVAACLRLLLALSPTCLIQEIDLERPGSAI